MKVGILFFPSKRRCNQHSIEEAEHLVSAFERFGHQGEIYFSDNFSFTFDHKGTGLWYEDSEFQQPDLIISWVEMLTAVAERSSVLQQVELLNIPTINNTDAVVWARSNLQTIQMLSAKGLPVIKTAMVHEVDQLDLAVKHIDSFPVVVKAICGSEGKGVAIFESYRSLKSGIELMLNQKISIDEILIQEFVDTGNKDYRLFVVGGAVVAQMERSAPKGDFRANLSGGGSGQPADLPSEVLELAVKAAEVFKLDVAGIDILLSDAGPVICEVNSRPGYKIEKITGVDVTGAIVKYAETLVLSP